MLVMSSIPLQNAFKVHLPLLQNMATDLFTAAYSGNIDLFGLLVQRFDLPPDQWRKVSVKILIVVCKLSIHTWLPLLPSRRTNLVVLSPRQPPGATLQW